MPESTSSRNFFAALALSVGLHAALLWAPVAPPAGQSVAASPARTQLAATLIDANAQTAVNPETPPQESNRPIQSDPGAPEEEHEIWRPGPPGLVESAQISPYLNSWEVDTRALPIDPPPLVLPEFILRQHIYGKVILRVFIGTSGSIDAVEVLSSTHPGLLEAAALDAINGTRFSPAIKNGVTVKNVKLIEVTFDPDESAPDEVRPVPSATGK